MLQKYNNYGIHVFSYLLTHVDVKNITTEAHEYFSDEHYFIDLLFKKKNQFELQK